MSKVKAKKPKPWKPKVPFAKLIVKSKRLELRPFRESDFAAWKSTHERRLKKQHEFDDGRNPKLTLANFRKNKKRMDLRGRQLGCFYFGIFHRQTGENLGTIDLYVINAPARWVNLGYAIHNHSWGKGYGPEAASLALDMAFGPLDLYRVEASCELENKPSAKTALRAGMFEEGLRRKQSIPSGLKDLYVFGMNSVDFKKRRR